MNEETLFHEALSRPPEERAAFLSRACAGRPGLRAAVEVLLAAHEKSGNLLDERPAELGRTADFPPVEAPGPATDEYTPEPADRPAAIADLRPPVAPGLVIAGRYTLVEKVGEGGMGDVWVATQTEPVKRKVALKLIKAGMDSRAVLQRFEQERQALAIMEHPNIARVIDGGMTAERRPFFVMELVNGLPLTRFCDKARMGIRERLELFASICQAVQHAHQKGIIHRDLKPSNILVTVVDGKPTPKVIDFGVAKATSGNLTDGSMSTQFGAVVGTLEYMSPEQAGSSGEDIDTRADIYSLGVILYELLTGLRPIDARRLKKAAFTEMIWIIKEEDPSKPSTRLSTDDSVPSTAALRLTEPKKLAALLRGELDCVVMKCLEKRRDRRYETASGLGRDIQRYLANEVVEARPPSARYRVRKFVSRHRGQVVAAGLLLMALLAGMAGTTWGLIREARANAELATANSKLTRSKAAVQARYDLAVDAIKTFHTGVSQDVLLKKPEFKDLRDGLLKSASDFYRKLGDLLGKETDQASRRALIRTESEIAYLTDVVGRKDNSLAAFRRVLIACESLAAEPGAVMETKADVGRTLMRIANVLGSTGKIDESLATYRKAEGVLAALSGSTRSPPPVRASLAACRSRIAGILHSTGHGAEALAVYRLARDEQEELVRLAGDTSAARLGLADTINGIGSLLSQMGQPAEAEAEHRRAIVIYQQLAGDYPGNTSFPNGLAGSHNELGILLRTVRPAEAEAEHRTALAIWQKLVDDEIAVTLFCGNLANGHNNLGLLYSSTGRPTEAEAEFRKAVAINQRLADYDPTATGFRFGLADNHHNLVRLLSETSKPAEAAAEYRKALAIWQKLLDDGVAISYCRGRLSVGYYGLSGLLSDAGKPAEAEAECRKAMAISQKLLDDGVEITDSRRSLSFGYYRLSGLLSAAGKPAEAAAECRKAMAIWQKLLDDGVKISYCHGCLSDGYYRLSGLLSAAGKPAEAEAECRKALEMRLKLFDEGFGTSYCDYILAEGYYRLSGLLSAPGRRAEAEAECREALAIDQKRADGGPTDAGFRRRLWWDHNTLGDLLMATDKPTEAVAEYRGAIATFQTLPDDHIAAADSRRKLACGIGRIGAIRRGEGKTSEAVASFRSAIAILEGLPTLEGADLYNLACLQSLFAGAARESGSGVPAAEGRVGADRAMAALLRAVAAGNRDSAHMRIDTDLDPLRDREDFRLLMMDLAMPADPFERDR